MTDKISEIQELLTDSVELIRFLTKKQFGLSGIGISDKTAFDWRKAEIYLEEKKSKGRMKYNAIEYVWLRLVSELREFGLSIEAIKHLKSYLLLSIDFKQMFLDMYEAGAHEEQEFSEIQNELKRSFSSNKELDQLLNEKELITTVLGMLIYSTIYTESDSYLLVKKDGSCFIHNENPLIDPENISLILGGEPYISFPVRYIVSDFIRREDLFELDRYGELFDYNEEEIELLKAVRERELNSLSAKTPTEEISFSGSHYVPVEEMDKIKGRLKALFDSNSHYEIIYKREDQKEVSLKK